jgi:hypothetical protein
MLNPEALDYFRGRPELAWDEARCYPR